MSVSDTIDQICDQYEAAFRSGAAPRIEDFLDQVAAVSRVRLLCELVALDFQLHLDARLPKDPASYLVRFADHIDALKPLLRDFLPLSGQSPAESTALLERKGPERVRHFVLQAVLGEGHFGTVWRAFDTRLHRPVALKLPRKDRVDESYLALVVREARAAAGLRHPHIVPVYEVGDGDGVEGSYIVTGLVEGTNLRTWLENNQPGFRKTAELMATIARAVQHAHSCHVVHRDLKPANILMDRAGAPHLADFGLAKRVDSRDSLAREGRLLGTPLYMAPEQARADHDAIDHRTDIYSLGVILYEMLVGKPPFKGELAWLLEQIATVAPPAPRLLKPSIPEDLEKVCLKCLEKDPRHRYQTAGALADDLDRFLSGESLRGVPVPLPKRIRKWVWRRRQVLTALALTSAASLAAAGGLWWWSQPPSVQRRVWIETEPDGCEITAVALDPKTGEPDPTKIQHAYGRTPLEMRLVPGDYLIVAVLDQQRFHEVYRHVPDLDERVPVSDRHLYWQTDKSGRIIWPDIYDKNKTPKIKIPRPDIAAHLQMGFVEGNFRWKTPTGLRHLTDQETMTIPSFYVDRTERLAVEGSTDYSNSRWGETCSYLEKTGRRMPSLLELIYLQSLATDPTNADANVQLSDATLIEGLFKPPREWSSTRGSLPAGSPETKKAAFGFRCVTADRPYRTSNSKHLPAYFGVIPELDSELETPEMETPEKSAVRGVRSAKPRRTPADFVSLVKDQ